MRTHIRPHAASTRALCVTSSAIPTATAQPTAPPAPTATVATSSPVPSPSTGGVLAVWFEVRT